MAHLIKKQLLNHSGITMLEIVIAAAMILIFAGLILPWQLSSWKRTSGYQRATNACQQIEKQIEQRRIRIGIDPETNYTAFKNLADTTIWDSTTTPPIKFVWKITAAKDRAGADIVNVRKVTITATLGIKDSIVVNTMIAKNF